MINKYQYGLRKYMQEFLLDKYSGNQDVIERIGHNLITEKDFKDFMKLVVDVYEIAYIKAINECKDKFGIKAEITLPK
jgi:hypothetical protein